MLHGVVLGVVAKFSKVYAVTLKITKPYTSNLKMEVDYTSEMSAIPPATTWYKNAKLTSTRVYLVEQIELSWNCGHLRLANRKERQ
jgi:hypothetical protein